VLSRVSRMIEEKGVEKCKEEISICNIFTQQAKRRMNQNLRRVDINEDEEMKSLSDFIVEKGSFPWDVL